MDEREAIHQAAYIAVPVFRDHKWTWASSNSRDRVPTYNEIVAHLNGLISQLTHDVVKISSGRFTVCMDDAGEVGIFLNLTTISTTEPFEGHAEVLVPEESLEDHLRREKNEWARLLRLQDWAIEVRVRRAYCLPDDVGQITVDMPHKEAVISLLDPRDYDPAWINVKPVSPHHSLLHELLHLHFLCCRPESCSAEWQNQEVAINSIAGALEELEKRTR